MSDSTTLKTLTKSSASEKKLQIHKYTDDDAPLMAGSRLKMMENQASEGRNGHDDDNGFSFGPKKRVFKNLSMNDLNFGHYGKVGQQTEGVPSRSNSKTMQLSEVTGGVKSEYGEKKMVKDLKTKKLQHTMSYRGRSVDIGYDFGRIRGKASDNIMRKHLKKEQTASLSKTGSQTELPNIRKYPLLGDNEEINISNIYGVGSNMDINGEDIFGGSKLLSDDSRNQDMMANCIAMAAEKEKVLAEVLKKCTEKLDLAQMSNKDFVDKETFLDFLDDLMDTVTKSRADDNFLLKGIFGK
mmetsp:Transcript_38270/g.43428  ORF Transcript_38270/g.43428 Transcript_38270/m.43428 type:complete len:297 (+) Transcript_38270:235-1125(+)